MSALSTFGLRALLENTFRIDTSRWSTSNEIELLSNLTREVREGESSMVVDPSGVTFFSQLIKIEANSKFGLLMEKSRILPDGSVVENKQACLPSILTGSMEDTTTIMTREIIKGMSIPSGGFVSVSIHKKIEKGEILGQHLKRYRVMHSFRVDFAPGVVQAMSDKVVFVRGKNKHILTWER